MPVLFKDQPGIKVWLLCLISAFLILLLSPLMQKGCFIDGMLYKTVAFNYAEGLSSFWQMKFTDTSMSEFCEQPPLYFYVLGNLYKVFGVADLTDRVFTLTLFALLIFCVYQLMKLLFKHHQMSYLLMFILFMLSVQVVCWSYVNQVIEPLVCVFAALGTLFFIQFLNSGKMGYAVLFSLMLCCLFLTKGFQSCFIIMLPIVYLVLSENKKPWLFFLLICSGGLVAFIFICADMYAPAKQWFDCYYRARLVLTMQNVGHTTTNHFEIIGRFFSELLGCIGVIVVLLLYLKYKKKYPLRRALRNFMSNKIAVSFLVTSLAGSFPYAVSLVQRGFYLVPSFIFFILAMLYGFRRYVLFLFVFFEHAGKYAAVRRCIVFLFAGALFWFFMSFNTYKRNEELLIDLDVITPYFKKGEKIFIEADRWNDFSLHAYLYMDKQVSLTRDAGECKFFIRTKSTTMPDSLQPLELNTRELDLFVLKR